MKETDKNRERKSGKSRRPLNSHFWLCHCLVVVNVTNCAVLE